MRLAIEQGQRQLAPFKHLFDLGAPRGVGAGQHEAHTRHLLAKALGGVEEQRAQAPYFAAPTARHQCHHRPLAQAQRGARGRAVGF
ncbi:hypothetical protein D3C79_791130 [compost metagenome]